MIDKRICVNAEKEKNIFEAIGKKINLKHRKSFDGTEYEIKLSSLDKESLFNTNKKISAMFEETGNYYINRVEKHTDYKVYFFYSESDGFEYSVFLYENKMMMKIKKHERLSVDLFTLCKSSEEFDYNYDSILATLDREDIQFVGNIQKERVKDFIIDLRSGYTYASAISMCTCNGNSQFQYELEYYGHFQEEKKVYEENDIIDELVKSTKVITDNSSEFIPDNETKFEFLNKNNSKKIDTKEQAIIDIKKMMDIYR